jgi:hypothetical protein
MTSARICVNNPANSKLDCHYNIVPKIHLKSSATPGLRDDCNVPHFLYYGPLCTNIEVQKDKSFDTITIDA